MKKSGRHPLNARRRLTCGFTLIELMIAVAIIGILMAIAVPSYHAYIKRANRAEARQKLQDAALWLQQAATNSATGEYPANFPAGAFAISNNSYTIAYTLDPDGTGSVTDYRLIAVRRAGTIQANDECGDYTQTQANVRGITFDSGSNIQTNTDLARRCWGK